MYVEGRDAAFASGIGGSFGGVVAGYYGGPWAYHVWPAADWIPFRANPKLPIWVAGLNGTIEGQQAGNALRTLGCPPGTLTAVDMETRVDDSYLRAFWDEMQKLGQYRVLVYGSRSTIFQNIQLNGYWVADYTGMEHMAVNPITGDSLGVRGTQWTNGPNYDITAWKQWVTGEMWH